MGSSISGTTANTPTTDPALESRVPLAIEEIDRLGFAIVPRAITADQRAQLIDLLGPVSGAGRRGLLALPAVSELARSPNLLDLVRPHFHAEPFPVRAIYFDKSPDANWMVPWHQDMTLALRTRAEVSGFGPWSTKDGIPHVQPPLEFLQRMLTVRLHLDDTDEANGALRVLPGSHLLGRLSATHIDELRRAARFRLPGVRGRRLAHAALAAPRVEPLHQHAASPHPAHRVRSLRSANRPQLARSRLRFNERSLRSGLEFRL
jgi:hypothetical protein